MKKTCEDCKMHYHSSVTVMERDILPTINWILRCRHNTEPVEKNHTCDKWADPRMNSTRFIEDEE